MLYPVKRHLTQEVLSATEVPSASTLKILAVEQGRFLKREWRVRSCKFKWD